jgi:CheY-like chemotaxis protein
MMPGMDGIEEAAAAIRSLGINDTPIITLTANAVSGMREVLIEKWFNDYISKPIEKTELDSVIAKWIPPEKKVEMRKPLERAPAESAELAIKGIDAGRGFRMTGGTEAGYRRVPARFYTDAHERLPVFAAPPAETGLSALAIQAHAIKGAAGTIGAAEVSAEAAALETAGKAGDVAAIREAPPAFHKHLAELIEGIKNVLEEKQEDGAGGKTPPRF